MEYDELQITLINTLSDIGYFGFGASLIRTDWELFKSRVRKAKEYHDPWFHVFETAIAEIMHRTEDEFGTFDLRGRNMSFYRVAIHYRRVTGHHASRNAVLPFVTRRVIHFLDFDGWRWSSAADNRRDLPQLDNALGCWGGVDRRAQRSS